MKRQTLIVATLAAAMALPSLATAQASAQRIPDGARTIAVKGDTRMTIVQDTASFVKVKGDADGSVAKLNGTELTFDTDLEAELHLKGREGFAFVAKDDAKVVFAECFDFGPSLSVEAHDDASVTFGRGASDTVAATIVSMRTEDDARIDVKAVLSADSCTILVFEDSQVNYEKHSVAGVLNFSKYVYGDGTFNGTGAGRDDELTAAVDNLAKAVSKRKVRMHDWGFDLDFAWGWHNWGSTWYNGFGGVEGDAALNTSFNNIQLSFNYPTFHNNTMALYLGLGLEWDVFKFSGDEVTFTEVNVGTNHFTAASAPTTSTLRTRFVTLPVSLCVRLGGDWSLEATAMPGLRWDGKNSGMHVIDVKDDVKDETVNRYMNPYKFDLRLSLRYNGFGIYVQTAMLSAFKEGSEELYPIKFGLIL